MRKILLILCIAFVNNIQAADLTIPNTFTPGTPAVAAEVNSNFTAVESAVDDNNTNITTNATGIGVNATATGANATAIGANTTATGANATAIGANSTAISGKQDQLTTSCATNQIIKWDGADWICADLVIAKHILECSIETNTIGPLSSTTSDIAAVAITVPSTGKIYVTASGIARLTGPYDGSTFQVSFSITNATSITDNNASNYWGPIGGGFPIGFNIDQPIQEHNDFVIFAAGSYSFFLTGKIQVVPSAGSIFAGKSKICAHFIPD